MSRLKDVEVAQTLSMLLALLKRSIQLQPNRSLNRPSKRKPYQQTDDALYSGHTMPKNWPTLGVRQKVEQRKGIVGLKRLVHYSNDAPERRHSKCQGASGSIVSVMLRAQIRPVRTVGGWQLTLY